MSWHRPRRARAALWLALSVAAVVAATLPGSIRAATSTTTFAPPVYVDQQLAGGEPTVFADTLHGRLIYTSHEGTTHLYRDGITSSPLGRLQLRLELLQPGQRLDVDGRRRQLDPRPLPRLALPGEPDLHGLQRPRPDPGRGRPRLQHRHQPRQRRPVLVQRRRRHVGQGHRPVPRRRPAVARRRPGEPGLPRHRHARGQRQRPPGVRLERRRQQLQPHRDQRQRLARRRRLVERVREALLRPQDTRRGRARRSSTTATAASASASARCRSAARASRRTRATAARRCTGTGRRSRSTRPAPSTSSGTRTRARRGRAAAATARRRPRRTRS